ncbi:MAG: radical SAM protein, partial [Oscillospiraceae bacterium]|nr:radical SAM protein [Oscillospiraceae bacterium]
MNIKKCELCPRKCGVDRTEKCGFCGETDKIRIANFQLHFWEEPVISGKNGSGTVFFSGCVLKCVFCQNYEISAQNKGYEVSVDRLSEIFLELQEKGAHNINLVNPTHFVPQIIEALDLCSGKLTIPVVYNSGGYERVETIEKLKGYVDVFLPDLKYFDSDISKEYSKAEDYFINAISAIKKMAEITGKPIIENGLIKRGTIVRHLVLPNSRKDSIALIEKLGETFKKDEI